MPISDKRSFPIITNKWPAVKKPICTSIVIWAYFPVPTGSFFPVTTDIFLSPPTEIFRSPLGRLFWRAYAPLLASQGNPYAERGWNNPEGLDLKITRQMTGKTRHLRLCYFQLRFGVFFPSQTNVQSLWEEGNVTQRASAEGKFVCDGKIPGHDGKTRPNHGLFPSFDG